MSDIGYINVTYKEGKPESYTWEGGSVVFIDYAFLYSGVEMNYRGGSMPDSLVIGQFKLKKLYDDFGGSCYYRVESYWDWFRWAKHRLEYFSRDVKQKIILTLYIWGLAYHEPHRVPTWNDVKLMKWIQERLK